MASKTKNLYHLPFPEKVFPPGPSGVTTANVRGALPLCQVTFCTLSAYNLTQCHCAVVIVPIGQCGD